MKNTSSVWKPMRSRGMYKADSAHWTGRKSLTYRGVVTRSTFIRFAMNEPIAIFMFGQWERWASNTAARGMGKFAPTPTFSPSSRSLESQQAISSFVL